VVADNGQWGSLNLPAIAVPKSLIEANTASRGAAIRIGESHAASPRTIAATD
jgi:hypothetical protein